MGSQLNIVSGGAAVAIGADLGYIQDGITITPQRELLLPDNIETLKSPPVSFLTKENYGITFTLVETTRDNLKIWIDSTNVESGTDPKLLNIGHGPSGDVGEPTERLLVVKSLVPGVKPARIRTITFARAVADAPGEYKTTQFAIHAFPCSFTCIWDPTASRLFQVSDVIA